MLKNWEQISFIKRSKYREIVLQSITNPVIPTQLKKKLSIDKAHVSRALASLVREKLAVCLTPKAKKFKLFKISELGKKALKELENLK